jgi:hypothetical protein
VTIPVVKETAALQTMRHVVMRRLAMNRGLMR